MRSFSVVAWQGEGVFLVFFVLITTYSIIHSYIHTYKHTNTNTGNYICYICSYNNKNNGIRNTDRHIPCEGSYVPLYICTDRLIGIVSVLSNMIHTTYIQNTASYVS